MPHTPDLPHHRTTLPELTLSEPASLRITGDLDAFTAPAIEAHARATLERHPRLVLDLSEVGVLTSGGLALLERCHDHAVALGHRLSLAVPEDGLVARVLAFSHRPLDATTRPST